MCAQGRDFTAVVDPFIGCGAIEGGLSGNNYPGATVPFGMVQLSPDTHPVPDWYNASGYDYNDSTIYCFSHTRLSGTGASDLIDIGVFPTVTGKTSSGFSHDAETASPGYYSVMLKDEGILAELTATTRTGIISGHYATPAYSVATVPEGETQYTTFSLWDTYRGAHPLYTILYPEFDAAFVNSMLRHYRDYGYLPIWHLWGQDNYCMIGNHAIPVVVDAVLKGLPDIDPEEAYEAVRESSLRPHPNSPFDIWERYGYMPEPLQTQSVSITLEMAYDDWCVARLARHLGKTEDYERFSARAQYYRNLHDPTTGFFRAKDEEGRWIEPFDPLRHGANGGFPFTEGNAWQYYWYVPHDVPGLIELTGGEKAFRKKLDTFFTLTDTSWEKNNNISGCIGQYAHGNEPSHHVAYLYNYAGEPQKTQDMVMRIMKTLYNDTSSGYAGNDDCGEMSAWYVFSALGFYPVNPASGRYDIGTPLFDEVVLHLPGGKDFTITADRKTGGAHRVSRVTLDGKPVADYQLPHEAIVRGGEMRFSLK